MSIVTSNAKQSSHIRFTVYLNTHFYPPIYQAYYLPTYVLNFLSINLPSSFSTYLPNSFNTYLYLTNSFNIAYLSHSVLIYLTLSVFTYRASRFIAPSQLPQVIHLKSRRMSFSSCIELLKTTVRDDSDHVHPFWKILFLCLNKCRKMCFCQETCLLRERERRGSPRYGSCTAGPLRKCPVTQIQLLLLT